MDDLERYHGIKVNDKLGGLDTYGETSTVSNGSIKTATRPDLMAESFFKRHPQTPKRIRQSDAGNCSSRQTRYSMDVWQRLSNTECSHNQRNNSGMLLPAMIPSYRRAL
jgi:hypothetical protein